ncbi:hypothetical protein GNI_060150 [Gregarina niphandrodes]|uniref:Uncharacterized protein n=1 Tax=Gregarina niphandrodes TaxID=110365 RepID=A0A023B8D7_GRENI|nr:hypothetical protein GNI_060150 [Gregarina niphandrodes]EZG69033.1 hypothetical protein GNI_060150 [Gregarina niphandrodes]|eukprot:XP_011134504.1 hypothetical protein GNI_060150 [Gregarina niphandrodes]
MSIRKSEGALEGEERPVTLGLQVDEVDATQTRPVSSYSAQWGRLKQRRIFVSGHQFAGYTLFSVLNSSGNPPVGELWKVYKDNNTYQATTWVGASDIGEDCSEVCAWDGRAIYATKGIQAHIDGALYKAKVIDQDAPFDVINVMNMDYGECPTMCSAEVVDKCERDAIDYLTKQLYDLANARGKLQQYGWSSQDDVYHYVGSTPMLGMNDSTCLTYTLEAAKTNVAHWQEKKIGMISNWSVARDKACPGQTYVGVDCSNREGQTLIASFPKYLPRTSAI